ncbi:MAG: TVP38/TMEM64 family protein [Syntrophobacteraceae bacterium]|nr:TVP38/TMEM64 family protein [Syntrophobacteraceae bacterium]
MPIVKRPSSEQVECPFSEIPRGEIKKNAVWAKLAVLLFLIGITIILYQTNVFRFFFSRQEILEFLESLGPMAFAGFILLQAAQVVLAPIPGEVTGLIGGFLFGPVLGVLLSTVGLVAGSLLAFLISRSFGRPFIERFIDPSVMRRFDYLLHHKGLFLVFVLFLIPGFPKDYLCFILGLGHLTIFEFLTVSTIGRLFGTILLTLGGGFIRYHQYGKLSVLIGGAALFSVIVYVFRDRLERWFAMYHSRHECKKGVRGSGSVIS